MSDTSEAGSLLLVEAGATVPGWLDLASVDCLDQQEHEDCEAFAERSLSWVACHPAVSTVVVALRGAPASGLDERVQNLGSRLVDALGSRPKARLLFGAPADTPERQRRRILGLTAELAQRAERASACVVGAHFSANPPSSGRIPIVRT